MRKRLMSPSRAGGALMALLVLFPMAPRVSIAGKGGGGGAKDVPLQITLRDSVGDRIQSDVPEDPYKHGVEGVSAYINGRSPRQITLDTNSKHGTPREVFLQFFEADENGDNSLCAPHGECTPPFDWRFQPINLRLGLVGLGTGITWQGLTVGQQAPGRLDLIFKDEAGGKHILKFNPSGFEWTHYVTVACNEDLDGECVKWTVEAASPLEPDEFTECSPPAAPDETLPCGNKAILLRHPKKGGEESEGVYYMDFQMTIEVCSSC